MELKVKRLTETARLPEKAHQGDLGYDVFADEDVLIPAGKYKLVSTGISVLSSNTKYGFIIKDRRHVTDAFLLGVLIYGVYDFTNYATLKKWTLAFSIKDTLWGGTVFTLSTFIIYKILGHI